MNRHARPRRRDYALGIEPLESRALLSATAPEVPGGLTGQAEVRAELDSELDIDGHFHHGSLIVMPLTNHKTPRSKPGSGDGTTTTPHDSAPAATTAASLPYTPAAIRQAYGFNQVSQTGAGQTIAIVDAYADPTIASDLHTFDVKFGLNDPKLTTVEVGGTPTYNSGWATETALDVEWAHAIAPGANIMLVETTSTSVTTLLAGVDYATSHGANEVSMSWGGGETSNEASLDSHFNSHPGVSFTASSGDSGAGVSYPAAAPFVTAVGGTTLKLNAQGNRLTEVAWSGSGGGVSTKEIRPDYQKGVVDPGVGLSVPDVSYVADPKSGLSVYDSSSGKGAWYQIGGTSVGAPQWAALFALVNQGRAALGKTPLGKGLAGGTTEALYNAAGGATYSNAAGNYFDVASGSNGGSTATNGYDVVTGLGTPVANKLIPTLINS